MEFHEAETILGHHVAARIGRSAIGLAKQFSLRQYARAVARHCAARDWLADRRHGG